MTSSFVTLSPKRAMPPSTVSTALACPTSWPPTAPKSFVTKSWERLRITALTQEARMARRRPPRALLSIAAMRRMGARPSKSRELENISSVDGTETHIKRVQGSNLSRLSPVMSFCWKVALVDRAALARKTRSIPGTLALTSPSAEIAQPMATARQGMRSHLLKGRPMKMTMPTVQMHVVEPKISVNATEEKPSAMLSAPTETEVAREIGRIMARNSADVGTAMGAEPSCARLLRRTSAQTRPLQRKWKPVTNFGNLKAYSTKTHFTVSFIVARAIRYTMTLMTTPAPRCP
mmetsp:Transcript_113372/g.315327  ORF Transcript_113372/g.315327 Transcript_113372/m.315327 type:complete len:291 (-) Transcript_113372:90-962(-)